jgi:putative serine protease PepD
MSDDGSGDGTPRWWSHPDGPTGRGTGFGPPAGRLPSVPPPDSPSRPVCRRRPRRPALGLLAGSLLVVLGAGLLGGGVGAVLQGSRQGGRITLQPVTAPDLHREPGSTASIVQAALPGVVYLRVTNASGTVTGTGIVLDGRGHILTNNHVVAPQGQLGQITVVFNSGQQHPAVLIGRDVGSDLAVVQVEGVTGLHPLALGSADQVQIGDPVLAIGAPFGLRSTVTSGIVSALDRPVTMGGSSGGGPSFLDALQTDAAINPGNSGGPLLDASGAVIGVNTAIRSADAASSDPYGTTTQAGSIGLGFAIPIDQAMRVAEQIIDGARVTHSVLGVTLAPAYQGGAQVLRSLSRTPAGLLPGDVVTAVDGSPVGSADDLIALVRGRAPGSEVRLTVLRGPSELLLAVRLRAATAASAADTA